MEGKWYQKPVSIVLLIILFFPVGLYLMWKYSKWSPKVKWVISGIFALLLLINMATSDSNKENNAETKQTSSQSETLPINQQMKDDFTSFYKEFMAIGTESDNAHKVVTTELDALSNGKSSVASVYLEAKNAEEAQGRLSTRLSTLKVPDSLKSHKNELDKAKQNMSTAIYSRKTAMKSMAELLNTGDLEKMVKIKQDLQLQQSFMLEAVGNLLSVASKLEVDTSKLDIK